MYTICPFLLAIIAILHLHLVQSITNQYVALKMKQEFKKKEEKNISVKSETDLSICIRFCPKYFHVK